MKNRILKRGSILLCSVIILAIIGTSAYVLASGKQSNSDKEHKEEKESQESKSAGAVDKAGDIGGSTEMSTDETVYVLAGADGTVKRVIVSDEIENKVGGASLEKELPVQLSVQFTLDGKKTSPKKMAGKSGHVKIRFDYENMQYEEAEINGKTEKIHVPFTMLTGMLLDNDVFQNVAVSNGKIVNDGDRIAVVGMAFPGLQEDLKVSKDKLDIPDYVEVSADVKNFKMGDTMTLATTELFRELDSDSLNMEELTASMNELTDAMLVLLDGSSQLSDGLCTLSEKSGELVGGIDQLHAGAAQLQTGASSLDNGAGQIQEGIAQLSDGLDTLDANSDSLNGGAEQVFQSLLSMANAQLAEAGLSVPALTIESYAGVLDEVIASLDDTAVYEEAMRQVTEQVEANRDMIREQVAAAVREQVYAGASAQVAAAVKEQVAQAVRENEGQFRSAVIQQATGMSVEEYEAAVEAGAITQEQQEAVNAAVESAMQAETEARMESQEVEEQISALTEQAVEEQMQSGEIQEAVAANTELQVQKAISEAMSSDAVQSKLNAAAEGAQSVIGLKASLDSYHAFYLGLRTYTSGVSDAAAGADELKSGAGDLKAGTSELSAGAARLLEGTQEMKDSAPALVDGITQLKDGSIQLSDGLKQFNEEGIQKLTETLGGDLKEASDRIRILSDIAKNYGSFAGTGDGTGGNVKFIYKTDAI